MRVDGETLIDYALGTIDPAEAREVENHLARRPELAAGLRRMQDGLAEMVMHLPREELAVATEERLVEVVKSSLERNRGRRRSTRGSGPLWVALGLAITLGLTAWLVSLRLGGGNSAADTVTGRAPEPLLDDTGERVGVAVRLADGSMFLALDDELSPEGSYQLWASRGDERQLLGTAAGRAVFIPELPEGSNLLVTREGIDDPAEPWLELVR